jgi:hypothetical protein
MNTHTHDSPENPHAGQGCVLLDIGGDVGALVVSTPATMVGTEVEIAPEGVHLHHRPHVAVVRRPVEGGQVPALVFPDLTAGRYALYPKGTDRPVLAVDVRGGEVTSTEWPLR